MGRRKHGTMPPEQRIEARLLERKRAEMKMALPPQLKCEASLQRRIERSCCKINNEKSKLVVALWKTSQHYEVTTDH
jgi:hypothetical protein